MIYRVVIIDNKGNEVSLTEKDGKGSFDGEGEVDYATMMEALDKLKEAKLDER